MSKHGSAQQARHGSPYEARHTRAYQAGNTPVYTIVVPWRKSRYALPAVALISAAVVLSAQPAPARDIKPVTVSKVSPAIVIPGTALTIPAVPARILPRPAKGAAQDAPALVLPAGTVPGSSTPVTLDSNGIPARALAGYRRAASLVDSADPACHIDWALLAAIGRVESDHGRFGGSQLDSAGVDQPGVFGIPLNGLNGTALITDTGGNALDGSGGFARAEGPMQFIPSTWRVVGVDANGDGVKNPQSIIDAATSAAVYLCSGDGDLRRPAVLNSAILRYNASASYVATVIAIADAYRLGVTALPASALPASALPASYPAPPRSAARQPGLTPSIMLVPKPRATLVGPTPTPSTPRTAPPTSTATTTCAPVPASTSPTSTAPTSTAPTSTAPTSTASTSTAPTSTASTSTASTSTAPTSTAPTSSARKSTTHC
jgi:Transglycosylase SLT domain